jgi:isopenicillin-N epimerase
MVLSNNAEHPKEGREQFLTEFEYVGTNDLSAFYCIPDALRCMETIHAGGVAGVMAHNHALVMEGRRILCDRLGVAPPAPEELIGSIATIILPAHDPDRQARLAQRSTKYHDALWDTLLHSWRIQVPVWTVPGSGSRTLRISAQLYNSVEQYEYLAEALASELAAEGRG